MNRGRMTGAAAALPILVVIASAQGVFEKRVSPVNPNETQSFQKQVKVALIVGVSKYPTGSGFSALYYAAADADDLAAVLKQQGYLVRVLTDTDAMRGSIENTLVDLSGMVDPQQGTFLFYFSGHGFSVEGKNYLVPVSASVSTLERDGLAVDEVMQLLAKSRAKRQLMLLDACRSDESGTKGIGSRSFAAFQASQGLRILNSTKIGKVSYESNDLRHGIFTAFLLKGLEGAAAGDDGLVTFHDLADYVTDSVRRWSNDHGEVQVPYEATGMGEASGDFLLAGKMPASAPALPLTPVPAATAANSAQSDVQRYVEAMAIQDPDQLDTIANTISTKTYADALRNRAEMLRGRGATPTLPAGGTRTGNLDPRAKMRMLSAKTEADLYAKRGNYMQALPLYEQAAEAGDSQAMVNVGMIYRDGLGTAKDNTEALKWFQKSADLGEPQAMGYLGMMYWFGEGIGKNEALACQWDRKAAEQGSPMGTLGLGVCYQTGRGVAKNLTEAASWYQKAAALGDPTAKQLLREMGK